MDSGEFNPYAAPGSSTAGNSPSGQFRLDYRRLSYRDLRRLGNNPVIFLFLAGMKTFRVPPRFVMSCPIPPPTAVEAVDRDEIPAEAWERWRDAVVECQEAGLIFASAFRIATLQDGAINCSADFVSEDKLATATLSYTRAANVYPDAGRVYYSVASSLEDGRKATTWGSNKIVHLSPSYLVNDLPGASISRLLESHREWIQTLGSPVVRTEGDWHAGRDFADSIREFDERVKRKIYVPIPQAEYEKFVRHSESVPKTPQVPGTEFDLALALLLILLMPIAALLWVLGNFWPGLRGIPFKIVFVPILLIFAIRYIRNRRARSRLKRKQTSPEPADVL